MLTIQLYCQNKWVYIVPPPPHTCLEVGVCVPSCPRTLRVSTVFIFSRRFDWLFFFGMSTKLVLQSFMPERRLRWSRIWYAEEAWGEAEFDMPERPEVKQNLICRRGLRWSRIWYAGEAPEVKQNLICRRGLRCSRIWYAGEAWVKQNLICRRGLRWSRIWKYETLTTYKSTVNNFRV